MWTDSVDWCYADFIIVLLLFLVFCIQHLKDCTLNFVSLLKTKSCRVPFLSFLNDFFLLSSHLSTVNSSFLSVRSSFKHFSPFHSSVSFLCFSSLSYLQSTLLAEYLILTPPFFKHFFLASSSVTLTYLIFNFYPKEKLWHENKNFKKNKKTNRRPPSLPPLNKPHYLLSGVFQSMVTLPPAGSDWLQTSCYLIPLAQILPSLFPWWPHLFFLLRAPENLHKHKHKTAILLFSFLHPSSFSSPPPLPFTDTDFNELINHHIKHGFGVSSFGSPLLPPPPSVRPSVPPPLAVYLLRGLTVTK